MKTRLKPATVLTSVLIICSFFITSGFSFLSGERWARPVLSASTPASAVLPMTDVRGNWAEAAIAEMYAKNVMRGYMDATFRPNKPVTLLEAVVMLDRLLYGKPLPADLNSNSYLTENFNIPEWAVGYVASAMRNELLMYSELQKLSQRQPLTRQYSAVLAVRALELTKQVKGKADASLSFTDSSQIDDDYKAYVAMACERKVMNGFPDGRFMPAGPISRAEMSVLLSNIAAQLPYVNSQELSGFIKSVRSDAIVLSDSAGSETTVTVPRNYLVYLNEKAAGFENLGQGQHLRVINADPGLTVFLISDVVPDTGTAVTAEPVNLWSAPSEVQQWVETNKSSQNFLSMVFNNNLYLLVTRGEKKTGGFTVTITKASVSAGEKGTNYRVWVDRSDPTRDAIVTPALTYPFDLVRITSPKKPVESIVFVDKLNEVLAETTASEPG